MRYLLKMPIDLAHNDLFAASCLVSWSHGSLSVEAQGFTGRSHSSRSQKRQLKSMQTSGGYAWSCLSETPRCARGWPLRHWRSPGRPTAGASHPLREPRGRPASGRGPWAEPLCRTGQRRSGRLPEPYELSQ